MYEVDSLNYRNLEPTPVIYILGILSISVIAHFWAVNICMNIRVISRYGAKVTLTLNNLQDYTTGATS